MKNIFISSTFIDMQAERDMVQERVLPVLRSEARKYGDNVSVIDLRWGVDTSALEEEEGAAKVLQVCLDEIDRSHPYMLIFLGERYGTMMPAHQIKKSVCGREDKYTTNDYEKSITALEVEYGALSEQYGELNHCVVCLREPVVHMLDGMEKDLYAEHEENGERKLAALKERIQQELGETERFITYSCTWDVSSRQLVDFTSNGQPLETVLTNCFVKMFQDDWKNYENLSWQDKEQLAFRAFMENKLRSFVGREPLLKEYYHSVVRGNCPIILQGKAGSGKTAIMCKLVERLRKERKHVFVFFSGVGSMSTNAEFLVKQMVYYVENLLGLKEHFGEKDSVDDVPEELFQVSKKSIQYEEWLEKLGELCAKLPQKEKIYFCIDAMDQLFWDEHVEKLDFFVKGKNVQVVASCTDEFVLPMEAMVSRKVKVIPTLSKEDAKTVAKGILASYSRNAYMAIEEKILNKKNIGNPLYISLLVQRLNMMDMEELQKAMTEKEIIALGTGIIEDMPDETEEAIVTVIWNGIEKISKTDIVKNRLYEALEYVAISRNGLRMSDLQGIFEAQKRKLPVLDFTLLMKYLDSFFYMHEDDRIDFTHKSIRHGLRKRITDRKDKEYAIKEYLKTVDATDRVRMQEGMYYARIQRDKAFAKELIMQVSLKQEELERAIKNEAVADKGAFYCELLQTEVEEESYVRTFFLSILPEQLGLEKEEMQTKRTIGEAMITCQERLYEKCRSEESLRALSIGYRNMGRILETLGQAQSALPYYKNALTNWKQLYERLGSNLRLWELSINYNDVGRVLEVLGKAEEALAYYEEALKCKNELHEKCESEESLRDLSISYNNMGRALAVLNQMEGMRLCYEAALACAEQLYEKVKSKENMRTLLISYNNMARFLELSGQGEEALLYCKKALEHAKQLHENIRSEESLRDLSIGYNNVGRLLEASGQGKEALVYYEEALVCTKQLHEKIGSASSLLDVSISYNRIGHALYGLKKSKEALKYFEENMKGRETLYRLSKTDSNLKSLLNAYKNYSWILYELGKVTESEKYSKKIQILEGKKK